MLAGCCLPASCLQSGGAGLVEHHSCLASRELTHIRTYTMGALVKTRRARTTVPTKKNRPHTFSPLDKPD